MLFRVREGCSFKYSPLIPDGRGNLHQYPRQPPAKAGDVIDLDEIQVKGNTNKIETPEPIKYACEKCGESATTTSAETYINRRCPKCGYPKGLIILSEPVVEPDSGAGPEAEAPVEAEPDIPPEEDTNRLFDGETNHREDEEEIEEVDSLIPDDKPRRRRRKK